jgi:hypothetical protein
LALGDEVVNDDVGIMVVGDVIGLDIVPANGTCTATLIITTNVMAMMMILLISRTIFIYLFMTWNICCVMVVR